MPYNKSKVYSKSTTSCTTNRTADNRSTSSWHVRMLYDLLYDLLSNESTTSRSKWSLGGWAGGWCREVSLFTSRACRRRAQRSRDVDCAQSRTERTSDDDAARVNLPLISRTVDDWRSACCSRSSDLAPPDTDEYENVCTGKLQEYTYHHKPQPPPPPLALLSFGTQALFNISCTVSTVCVLKNKNMNISTSLALLKAKYCPRVMPVQHFVNPRLLCLGDYVRGILPNVTFPENSMQISP